jgi:hypothetical protein
MTVAHGAFYVSSSGGGSGIVTNNGAEVDFERIVIGRAADGQGTYVQNGGSVTGRTDIYVGDISRGSVLLNGGTVGASTYFHIGNAAGGDGTVTKTRGHHVPQSQPRYQTGASAG